MSDRDAFREASELKTPDEWCTELGYEVLDPDGWRGSGGRPWTDPISRAEFEQRLVVCTQRCVPVDERAEFRERRKHGLKARHETREARAVRKAVAEEIAEAIEALRDSEPVPVFAPRGFLTDAARIAREIGSRDPA